MPQVLLVDNSPNQSFRSVLSIDGENKSLRFKIRFNEIAEYWVMTIIDPSAEDTILIDSLPLIPGDYPADNILDQFAYLGIGSLYVVNIGNVSAAPSVGDLGTNFILIWGDTPNG